MNAVIFLPIVFLLACAYVVVVVAAERSVERRTWRRWTSSVAQATKLREGLRPHDKSERRPRGRA